MITFYIISFLYGLLFCIFWCIDYNDVVDDYLEFTILTLIFFIPTLLYFLVINMKYFFRAKLLKRALNK